MSPERADDPGLEDRRNEVLLAYVEAIEEGRAPDRAEFLAAHPDLRPDLEAFLDGHDEVARLTAPLRADRPTVRPVPAGPPGDEAEDGPPGLGELGDFRLLREVGRGGMGVVYEAVQRSLRRRVALKVLPFASAIDERLLQRFQAEAMVAAHVQHEQIVPVHAVGCERGVHYYAMQFIDGQSLADLIRDLRLLPPNQELGADPATAAGPPEMRSGGEATKAVTSLARERDSDRRRWFDRVASIGRQAALALDHAHRAGIVHRDVKPGNLLLDLRGQIWVTDFGLAQVAGESGLTLTGELLGTIRYASPEQLLARRGIVDHRSDIYSLGATLFELLTLRPPFEGRDRNALIRQIAEDDPPGLSDLDRTIPRELETIALKALRKEPADRYGTAREMADDLGRFLKGRPILARRPTPSERIRGWSRRHPSIVGAGVVALILLTAASLVGAALIRREQDRTLAEKQNAEAAYRRERQRAEEAEERLRLAQRAVDELIRASEEELAHRPGMAGLRKRLLTSALDHYQEFIAQRRNDPDAQAELRDTSRRVESILNDLAVLRAAGELYLLAQPSAQEDLKLDVPQRAKVADLSARAGRQWRETFGDPDRRPPPARRLSLALEQAHENDAEVEAILSTDQRLRLRQLALQVEGLAAFREPEVIEALGLSRGQREQIRAIEEQALLDRSREWATGTSGPFRGPGADRRPTALDEALALLSPEQANRWNDLVGEPIRGPLSSFRSWYGP